MWNADSGYQSRKQSRKQLEAEEAEEHWVQSLAKTALGKRRAGQTKEPVTSQG